MLLPIKTSIKPWRTPYANYAIIAINIVLFFFERHTDPVSHQWDYFEWVHQFMLNPNHPYIWQFVTYAFLHSNLMHILSNMFFLYLFGNNVNDKLGHLGYVCFYLTGAVFGGIGHALTSSSPVLGASGAVAAIIGAYLVLFPQTMITVLYWLIFIGTVELPAIYFIAFKMIILDNIIAAYSANIAYEAHLSGYAFGAISILVLLATRIISTTNFDLWAMIRQWNRRRIYRDTVSGGYDPYTGLNNQANNTRIKKSPEQQRHEQEIIELRTEIAKRISQRNLSEAANAYLRLITLDIEQILPRQQLLDIANQLASDNKPAESAQAYEKFLSYYKNYEYIEQIELMLGILYSRYLDKPELAVKHLENAEKKLHDPGQLKMCRDEIAKLKQ